MLVIMLTQYVVYSRLRLISLACTLVLHNSKWLNRKHHLTWNDKLWQQHNYLYFNKLDTFTLLDKALSVFEINVIIVYNNLIHLHILNRMYLSLFVNIDWLLLNFYCPAIRQKMLTTCCFASYVSTLLRAP